MPEQESGKQAGADAREGQSPKCAHRNCKCLVPDGRPFGDFCSDYCIEAAHHDPVVCQCGHVACHDIAAGS